MHAQTVPNAHLSVRLQTPLDGVDVLMHDDQKTHRDATLDMEFTYKDKLVVFSSFL